MTKNRLITTLILCFYIVTASIKGYFFLSFVPTGASTPLMSNDTRGGEKRSKEDGGSF